ncbi:MAG: UDP-4-amino-4,6-dideoxy-N-acetyl-beta-L-altrosamine N-acetyltransferase [Dethiobacter sp.]|jgi:UDP-4-amino-4,6-dideoxy-N-acetyl-beta-L-altrosamine N-acetyltransferase|nr:UDP-4-amino-4,6-dideoxy-N-acetyl-beta-L-altrosamine N-acetyltransferase [Dethiobacter sp.]
MRKFKEYKLTDLKEEFKKLILEWRNSDHIRKYMIDENIITEEEHNKWFESKKTEKLAKLLLFKEKPIGFVNFSDFDYKHNICYWGFYIGEKNAPKGSGLIMGLLALNYIFEECYLNKLYSKVLSFNDKSINYHKKIGFVEESMLKNHLIKNNNYVDIIEYTLSKENWEKRKKELEENVN